MKQKLSALLLVLLFMSLLAACSSSATNTPVPAASNAAGQATTAPAAAATNTAAPARPTATVPAAAATPVPTLSSGTTATGATLKTVAPVAAPPADAKKGGTLTIANLGLLAQDLHPNPTNANYTAAWGNIYNLIWGSTLIEWNFTNLEWELALAKDIKVDTAGKEFTFTLRPDLKWSDGSPLTVSDFQFSFDNISKENKENAALNFSGLADKKLVTSFKSDPATNTIVIAFGKAYNRDLALSFLNLMPMPKKVWEGKSFYDATQNPEIKKPTVVNGPYMIVDYDPDSKGTFKPNPNWYRGKANMDEIVLKSFGTSVISEALKTGQADIAVNSLPTAFYDDLKTNSNISMYEWYGVQNDLRYLLYNTTRAPFDDKVLRSALATSFNRTDLMKLAENGRAVPQYTFVYDVSPFFNPEVPRYGLDLERSKKMLADGGYKLEGGVLLGKDGKPLKFALSFANTDAGGKLVSTYLQQQLKQLGMEVTVEQQEAATYTANIVKHTYDMGTGYSGGGLFPDPDSRKNYYATNAPFNTAGYSLPRIDEIFDLGAAELDVEKRKKLYGELQVIMATDLPSQVVYSRVLYIAANKKLGGVVPHKGSTMLNNHTVANWYWKA